ncbi:MAG: alkaline phosphatase family protein [Chloroflexi bacterium]|nr:alkaline phosphatase family protein [Chloroflexota bacterium]
MRNLRRTKPINWFVLGILSLPLVAIGAYFWATGIFSALENHRSPLQAAAPAPGAELGEPLTRRVVIVLMDALRYDTSTDAALMPVLNELRIEGASAIMTSRPPSFSAPGWTTLLTGAWPDINDSQPFNPPDDLSVRTFTQDDIFAAADRSGLNAAVSGYTWFEGMLADSGLDDGFYTPGEDDAADQEVVAAALPWLTGDYQLILIHIDQIDYAGHHEGGPISPNWDAAAARSDALLGEIAAQLDLELDTLIVVSDHGQIDKGGHGGNEPVTMVEPFVAIGAGILPGQYSEIKMADVAPTLAVLLGTNLPASSQGRPLLEMLDIPPEQALVVLEAEKIQQSGLLAAYSDAIGQPAEAEESEAVVSATQLAMEKARMGRLAQERIWRNMIALFLAIVPGYLLYVRKEKKALWMLGGALVYLAIFGLRYIVLDKNTFGLSWIPGMAEFIVYMAVTTGIALILAWLAVMFGLRVHRYGPRQAAGSALGSVWFILYVLSIPILLNFAVNGVTATWTLPEFTTQYLGFFALAQVMFVSAIGLLLVGVSALIGRFVKKT